MSRVQGGMRKLGSGSRECRLEGSGEKGQGSVRSSLLWPPRELVCLSRHESWR